MRAKDGETPRPHHPIGETRRFNHLAETRMGVDVACRADEGEVMLTMPAGDQGDVAGMGRMAVTLEPCGNEASFDFRQGCAAEAIIVRHLPEWYARHFIRSAHQTDTIEPRRRIAPMQTKARADQLARRVP